MYDKTMVYLFADGGVIERNPSSKGGTYAWCGVSQNGDHLQESVGYLLPNGHPYPGWPRTETDVVTNNETEFMATLRALESMPDGWNGKICTDSEVTLKRWQRIREWRVDRAPPPIPGLPAAWQVRAKVVLERVTIERWVHLAGHPTAIDLARGHKLGDDGRKHQVSRHQVWCDAQCSMFAREHATRLDPASWVNLGTTETTEEVMPALVAVPLL